MPSISKTTVITAIGVAIGSVFATKFVAPHVKTMLNKVA